METALHTAPAREPVTIDEAKRHLRISVDNTDDDIYIQSLIETARLEAEKITWRKLITQSWYVYYDDWPKGNYIELPFGTLQSVTTIKYTDVDAAQSTWSSAEYIVGTDYQRGRVTLDDGYTWPNEVLYPSNPIEVDITCGYGTGSTDVPAGIRHAIKLMISDLYENREIHVVGISFQSMDTVNNLLSNYRLNKL